MELSYKLLAGLMVLIIAGTGIGTTYIIEDDGYKNCPGGWNMDNQTGMYDCMSRDISEWCFKLSSSGYRCYLGKPIQTENKEVNLSREDILNELIDRLISSKEQKECYLPGDTLPEFGCNIPYYDSEMLKSINVEDIIVNGTLYARFNGEITKNNRCVHGIPNICIEYIGDPMDEINAKIKSWVEAK